MDPALGGMDPAWLEALELRWRDDPDSVLPEWRVFFEQPEAPTSRDAGLVESAGAPATLGAVQLFAELSPEDRRAFEAGAHEVVAEDGAVLFTQGDEERDIYLVAAGCVLIQQDGRILAEMGPGDIFGELSLLEALPRSADAVVLGSARLVRVQGSTFEAVLAERPAVARSLLTVLARRLRIATAKQERVDQLVRAFRERGHVVARLDPLERRALHHPELIYAHYGLSDADLDQRFSSRTLGSTSVRTLREIVQQLKDTYCRYVGVQYMHIDDLEIQAWLQERMESSRNTRTLAKNEQLRILRWLTEAEVFEQFLHKKFQGAKRFSLEGGESLLPLMELAIEEAGRYGVEEVVIGMAHRGRLNVMANILKKRPAQIFREFADLDPDLYEGRGDVKYHLGHSSDWVCENGQEVHLSLCFNPSHLECVGPVVEGRVRAKQHQRGDSARETVMGLVIHGDSAIAGEGVNQELFNMSELEGYAVGGTVHVVLNNQIGFTTSAGNARSTQYCTDVARMLQIPIFHVNGEHPEAVTHTIALAMDFRARFGKDVVIDMWCYRRHGHNEGDEPAFTQPLMYQAIRKRSTVRQAYVANLAQPGGVTAAEADALEAEIRERLDAELAVARDEDFSYAEEPSGGGRWEGYVGGLAVDAPPEVETRVDRATLNELMTQLVTLPTGFVPHPKIKRFLRARAEMGAGERAIDWGGAEALALASLLAQGVHIRLSGQDAGRGTFSHRHSVLHNQATGAPYVPLASIGGAFEVWDSPLTETAVLGFDWGYSLDYPDALVIWEAQFGDFVNVAQVIIDQFISSAEDKWSRLSGLVMLLPHGFEGQGPEHSSARLERFLTLAAEDNLQVVNLTTPAQLFHLLRRQVMSTWRKPLIIMSPKSLLRHPAAVSTVDELAEGSYRPVLADQLDASTPGCIKRIVITSGKLYYELAARRSEDERADVALIRLEQYYPWPQAALDEVLSRYEPGIPVIWAQEEPANMGAWPFMARRLFGTGLSGRTLSRVTRPESASPATGSAASHRREQQELIDRVFELGS